MRNTLDESSKTCLCSGRSSSHQKRPKSENINSSLDRSTFYPPLTREKEIPQASPHLDSQQKTKFLATLSINLTFSASFRPRECQRRIPHKEYAQGSYLKLGACPECLWDVQNAWQTLVYDIFICIYKYTYICIFNLSPSICVRLFFTSAHRSGKDPTEGW